MSIQINPDKIYLLWPHETESSAKWWTAAINENPPPDFAVIDLLREFSSSSPIVKMPRVRGDALQTFLNWTESLPGWADADSSEHLLRIYSHITCPSCGLAMELLISEGTPSNLCPRCNTACEED